MFEGRWREVGRKAAKAADSLRRVKLTSKILTQSYIHRTTLHHVCRYKLSQGCQ